MAALCQRFWERAEVLPLPQPPQTEPVPHHTPLQQHQILHLRAVCAIFNMAFSFEDSTPMRCAQNPKCAPPGSTRHRVRLGQALMKHFPLQPALAAEVAA